MAEASFENAMTAGSVEVNDVNNQGGGELESCAADPGRNVSSLKTEMEAGNQIAGVSKRDSDDDDDKGKECECEKEILQIIEAVKSMAPPKINVNLNDTRYPVVKECCKDLGWHEAIGNKSAWNLSWLDCGGISAETSIHELNELQKVNHLPGMSTICQKCKLAWTLNRLSKEFPDLYNFHPRSFCLPRESEALRKWWHLEFVQRKHRPILIVKPDGGCQGQGIYLAGDPKDLEAHMAEGSASTAAQQYLSNPYLIEGYKFDLRLYVVVTGCTPKLRAFQHEKGLVRFATSKYKRPNKDNLKERYMHLTNYAINKKNTFVKNHATEATLDGDQLVFGKSGSKEALVDRVFNASSTANAQPGSISSRSTSSDSSDSSFSSSNGSKSANSIPLKSQEFQAKRETEGGFETKWSLHKFYSYLESQGKDVVTLKENIEDVVTKTLLSIQPSLAQEYRACFAREGTNYCSAEGFRSFEILGFDVLLDNSLKPWVIEVNHSPSFHCDTELDHSIKHQVISESLVLSSIDADDLLRGKAPKRPGSHTEQKVRLAELIGKRSRNISDHEGSKMSSRDQGSELAQKLGKEKLEALIERLRSEFEDAHSGGFSRILPFAADHPCAEDYRRIEEYKPALFKESPATQRRREAIEMQRRESEASRRKHRAMVGDRPVWGSSTAGRKGSNRNSANNQNQEEGSSISGTTKSFPEVDGATKGPAPLPRVASLKPYQRAYKRYSSFEDSPRQLVESHNTTFRSQLAKHRQQNVQRQACAVRVQTLSFGMLPGDSTQHQQELQQQQPQQPRQQRIQQQQQQEQQQHRRSLLGSVGGISLERLGFRR